MKKEYKHYFKSKDEQKPKKILKDDIDIIADGFKEAFKKVKTIGIIS